MRAEVQLFEKSGTISFNCTNYFKPEIRIYRKILKDNLWFLIFQKAELQHAFPLELRDQF